jgi:hypothetical protein
MRRLADAEMARISNLKTTAETVEKVSKQILG